MLREGDTGVWMHHEGVHAGHCGSRDCPVEAQASSSDGGSILLRGCDRTLSLADALAADWRNPRQSGNVTGTFRELWWRRLFRPALGYADGNDTAYPKSAQRLKLLMSAKPATKSKPETKAKPPLKPKPLAQKASLVKRLPQDIQALPQAAKPSAKADARGQDGGGQDDGSGKAASFAEADQADRSAGTGGREGDCRAAGPPCIRMPCGIGPANIVVPAPFSVGMQWNGTARCGTRRSLAIV